MEIPRQWIPENIENGELETVLEKILDTDELSVQEKRHKLDEMGIDPQAGALLLAHHDAAATYNAPVSPQTLQKVAALSGRMAADAFGFLFHDPVFMIKAGWLMEHGPYYTYFETDSEEKTARLILDYAERYGRMLQQKPDVISDTDAGSGKNRVFWTTLWESTIIDPSLSVQRAADDGIEGVELSIDFQPHNPAKLLPAEIPHEIRQRIRSTRIRTGMKIDLHAPFIGPNIPTADPQTGHPCFNNPAECLNVQSETVSLAKDIDAGAVVIHLIDSHHPNELAGLVAAAAGSTVRVSIENYCQTDEKQTAEFYLSCMEEIAGRLDESVREQNFSATVNLGHWNIEGEDPLVAAAAIGEWCLKNRVHLRLHATDNYGSTVFPQPAHSAGLHGQVSGKGIDNALIVRMLRHMGLDFDVVAEQSHPLTPKDIAVIQEARTSLPEEDFSQVVERGRHLLDSARDDEFITDAIIGEDAFCYLAGIKNVQAVLEYLIFRNIQKRSVLSVEEAQRIYRQFIKMPTLKKADLTAYVDELVQMMHHLPGELKKRDVDAICQNISGALFGTISNEHLNQIFNREKSFPKGEAICRQDGSGKEMFFIKRGEVLVYIDGLCVASLGPGEIFGEMSLFYNIHRSATIIALEEGTKVGILDREGLELLFKSGHPYAQDLIYRFYKILPGRLRNLNERYKTAIHTLHLIFEGNPNSVPNLNTALAEVEQNKAHYFPTLSGEEIQTIADAEKTLGSGQMIFREGQIGNHAYYILEGSASVKAGGASGRDIHFGKLVAGDIFGEMALIDDRPRSATVITTEPTRVVVIGKYRFNEFIETRSKLAVRLMGFINLSMFRRILSLDRLYSDLKRKYVPPKGLPSG